MTAATFVGANAAVTGNNASLSPTIHASAANGDLLLLYAAIGNSSGVVNTPAGWTPILADGNVLLAGRYRTGTEGTVTVTFTGGNTGNGTQAQIAVFRTLGLDTLRTTGVFSAISNAAAQNITLPAQATGNRAGSVVLALGWKLSTWTGVATLTTEIGEPNSNNSGAVWDYRIDTTPTATPAGPFVVTGGTTAVSKGYVLALPQKAIVTATLQDVYPPRVLISVTNLVVGDSVTVYRDAAGERTAVRAGTVASASDVSFLVVDAELPFGVPVTYTASVNGVEYTTSATTYTLPGGKVALTDAITGDSAEVVVLAWPEKKYDRPNTIFKVAGRNIVDVGDLSQFEGSATLYTETQSSGENVTGLLSDATGGVIQIRSADSVKYDRFDCYVAVVSYTERRFSQDGDDERRLYDLDLVEVDGWASALQASGYTLQNVADAYANLTLANLSADYSTLLLLAQGNFS